MIRLVQRYLKGPVLLCAILAPLSMLLEVFMDLQQPVLMAGIIDIGVANGDLGYVLHTGLRMVLFALLAVVGGVGCSIAAIYASIHVEGEIRNHLFEHIFELSSAEVDKLETSSLVTRLTSDVSQVQQMLLMLLRSMFRSPMLCIGGVIMAFTLSPRLALILCATLPLLVVIAIFVVRRSIPLYTEAQEAMDRVNTVTRENLLGIRLIKALTLEIRQGEQFEGANRAYATRSIRAQTSTFVLMPIVTLVMNLSVVAVLWFGGLMQMEGALPMGRIMAFINYLVQITNAMVMLVNFAMNISRAQASAQRIQEVFAATPSVVATTSSAMPQNADIRLENVSFRYGEGKQVLQDVSLHITGGEKIGVIGATGCGKSTLAVLLARLYDQEEGHISIGGVDLRQIPFPVLRKKVGIVLQNSLLFSGTVADNLRYGMENATERQLWETLADASAEDFIRALPGRLDGEVAQRGSNFSGGQKQRLSIARSLLQEPDILILDDSTSAVDLLTEAHLQTAIRRRMSHATLIVIAQRISSIMDCNRVFVMNKGRIIAQGKHEDLLKQCELYRSIAISQLGEEAVHRA